MKSQLKKILAVVTCLCLVLSISAFFVSAETTATISFSDAANRKSLSTSEQVWEQNGVTVTNNKGASTSNVADYKNPARFYKSSSLKVEYPSMTKIEFACNSTSYATALKSSIASGNGTVTVSGKIVTVTLAAPADVYTIASLTGGQVRVDSITVYAEDASVGGGDDDEEDDEDTYEVPAADSVLTIPQALELGQYIAQGNTVTNNYYVVGEIKNVYNTMYGNMWIKDADGNEICIYGLYSADGSVRYDAMATKPVAGDTIKVYGPITVYNGNGQFQNAKLIEHTPVTPDGGDEEEDTYVVPAADSVLTVAQALELGQYIAKGNTVNNNYYVVGEIKNVYNTTYGNMYLKDADGNEICIYGLYSADGSVRYDAMTTKPVAGDTVKVYGPITVYNGNGQFQNAKLIEHTPVTPDGGDEEEDTYVVPAADSVLTIPQAIELSAYINAGNTVDNNYYMVGEIKNVYQTTYGNMYLKDADGNEFCVYGLYSADGSVRYDAMTTKPVAGDTVKVYGPITVYNGNGQFKNAKLIEHTPATPDSGDEDEDDTQNTDPAADSELTIEQAIALGNTKDKDVYTTGKYYITGKVLSVESPVYGNMYVEDENGNKILVYGVYNEDGSVRYDALETKPIAGDTVKLYGIIGKYNEPQMKNGWLIELTQGGGQAPEAPTDPKEIVDEAFALEESKYLPYAATLEGVVKEITEYSEEFGNLTLTITVKGSDGEKDLVCYRVKGVDDSIDLAAIKAGDTITVSGAIKNHYGTIEFDNSSKITKVVAADVDDDTTDDDNTNDDTTNDDTTNDDTTNDDTTTDDDTTDDDTTDDKVETPDTGVETYVVAAMLALIGAAAAMTLCVKKVRG